MVEGEVRIVAVGDVQPNRERPETFFAKILPEFGWGDLRHCQLECTISDRGVLRTDVRNPAHRVPPHNIVALTSAGINVVSYAGNNNLDYGIEAFTDTLNRLIANGIEYVGAGDRLEEARRPLYTSVNDVRIAWLNFCSILRDGYEATPDRPGISPLKVKTYYESLENIYEQPGTPCRTVTLADHGDFEAAMAQIRSARAQADVVIGCFHWGVHFTHDLAMYQANVGYAAIDNGCDLVLGTHPHCLQTVDVYKGKYIFYSLGNFAFEQPEAIAQHGVREYLSFYGVPLEPELKVHPHPRHCRKTILLKIRIRQKQIASVSFLPVYFTDAARPEVQEPGTPMYEEILGLMDELCAEIGTRVVREGREAVVVAEKASPVDTRVLLRNRKNSYPWLRRLATIVE
ncbi:MAG: CapA family protein [bacterium]